MKSVVAYINTRSKSFVLTWGYLLVGVLGLIDHFLSPVISYAIFYLVPVALVAWGAGRTSGVLVSITAGTARLLADLPTMAAEGIAYVAVWNAATGAISFTVVAVLLAAFRTTLEDERVRARTDVLTGLANRRHFFEATNLELLRALRFQRPVTLVYLDLDHFKFVNDQFGHATGDAVLCQVAKTICDTVRRIDIPARLGGDEFAILLPETGADGANVLVRKLQKNLLEAMHENAWPVTFSIGVLTCVSPPTQVEQVIQVADGLMYSVKHGGKNLIRHEVVDAETITRGTGVA